MRKFLSFLLAYVIATPAFCGFVEGETAFNQQHYSQAFSEFLPIANQGDFRSQYYVGYLYLNGLGIPQDTKEGLNYLQKAVDQNYDMAQSLMAFLYSEGQVVPKDMSKALSLYSSAAIQNNISANLNLGVMYYTGEGVEKNYAKALEYFKKVPVKAKPIVCRYMGDIYLNSSLRDYDKAVENYRISASQGDLNSFFTLGEIYRKGQGVPKNTSEAFRFYEYAASRNYSPAQYMLGILYANGTGVPRDIYKAYAWLSMAVEQKLLIAENALNQIAENMSLSDIDKAKREILVIQKNDIGKIEPPISPDEINKTGSGSVSNCKGPNCMAGGPAGKFRGNPRSRAMRHRRR